MRLAATSIVFALHSLEAHATTHQVVRAKIDAEALAMATELFTHDAGHLPQEYEWPDGLMSRPDGVDTWRGPYIGRVPKDPWGRAYRFHSLRVIWLSVPNLLTRQERDGRVRHGR